MLMKNLQTAMDQAVAFIAQHEPVGWRQIDVFTRLAGRVEDAGDACDAIRNLKDAATSEELDSAAKIAQEIYKDLIEGLRAAQKEIGQGSI